MEDWEDWRYLYRRSIFGSTSEPTIYNKENEVSDQKIDLLSEISSDFISYTDVKDIIQEMILLTFNCTHNELLTTSVFLGKYTY